MLELPGAVVGIDAIRCQKALTEKIIKKKADGVPALQDKHRQLFEDTKLWPDSALEAKRLTVHETVEKDHGRMEMRRYAISDQIDWLTQKPQWAGLKAVGMLESTRQIGDKVSVQRRYYLCSINDLQRFADVARGHWAIENSQHWVLDVSFNEDANRSRKDHSATKLAWIRRMALNFLRNTESSKRSLRQRKMRACFNDDYRDQTWFGKRAT